MKWALIVLAVLTVVALSIFRLAPSDPVAWHVDPLTAPPLGPNSVTLTPGGQKEPPVYAMTPQALMERFDAVIMATPRTRLLAGSVAEGFATYVVRSRVFGFPDYVSLRALPAPGGATFAIWSRARFGRGDWGVNRARLKGWLAQLSPGDGAATGSAGEALN